jgi:hypothetical protein
MFLVLPSGPSCALVKRTFISLSCLVLLWSGVDLFGQVSREYDVKAVFCLNFAQFVEWPTEAFPDSRTPITIGILGEDPFKRSIDTVVRNETVRNRPVVVQRYQQLGEIETCHILFISASEAQHLPKILQHMRGRPVLTVSEIDGFADRGGMIALYTSSQKVRLRINNKAARAANLTISSKLLRLADIVSTESRL